MFNDNAAQKWLDKNRPRRDYFLSQYTQRTTVLYGYAWYMQYKKVVTRKDR